MSNRHHISIAYYFGLAVLLTLGITHRMSTRGVAGYRLQIVLSGSMEPTIPTNSLVVIKKLPTSHYQEGDIVSFRPPVKGNVLVTHRLIRIYLNSQGAWVGQTKGDANTNGDPWTINLAAMKGKEIFHLPWAGLLFKGTRTQFGFSVLVLIFYRGMVMRELRWLKDLAKGKWEQVEV